MNRRGFFGSLAGLAAGMVMDPEQLLRRRGAKLISVPAPSYRLAGWPGALRIGDVVLFQGKTGVYRITGYRQSTVTFFDVVLGTTHITELYPIKRVAS